MVEGKEDKQFYLWAQCHDRAGPEATPPHPRNEDGQADGQTYVGHGHHSADLGEEDEEAGAVGRDDAVGGYLLKSGRSRSS